MDIEEFDKKVRGMHQEDVEELLGANDHVPTGQDDGDRDWLVQLYRNGEIAADTIPT